MSDEPEGPEDFPADVPDPHAEMHAALAQMDLTRQASRAAMLEMQGVLPDHDPDLGTDLAARVKRKLDSLKGSPNG